MKEELLIRAGKVIMACYARILLDYDAVWLAELPPGPKIFAANHPTTTDPFFLGLLTSEPMRILVTANAFEVPLFREYLRHAGHIPVPRSSGSAGGIVSQAVEYLGAGKTIGIFPEGALSEEYGDGYCVLPAHTGVARIALQSGCPIIPVGIALEKHGIRTREYQFSDRETTGRWMTSGGYAVTVGEPLFVDGNAEDRPQVRALADQVTGEIRVLVEKSTERIKQRQLKWNSILSPRSLLSS